MAAFHNANDALFTRLMEQDDAAASATWVCPCGGCGAGGNDVGAYATRPNDDSYDYSTPAQATAQDGGVAPLMAGSKWSSFEASTW